MSERRMWPTPTATEILNRTPTPGMGDHHRRRKGGNILEALADDMYPTAPTVSSQLTLFAEAFPASRTVLLADVPAPPTSATSGPSSSDSFASVDPDGSWRKTCQGYSQVTLDGSLARFSETWPRAGMTRSGIAYRRVPLAPLTGETESGSWPTPSSRDWKDTPGMAQTAFDTSGKFRNRIDQTARMVYAVERGQWPTPTAGDSRNARNATAGRTNPSSAHHAGTTLSDLAFAVNGSLNPTWVEWLMGYPLGWTACAAWGTASSRRSRSGSRGASAMLNPPGAAAG